MFSGVIIFFIVRGLWHFYQFLRRKHDYWANKRVLGPKPTFLIGNFPSIIDKRRHNIDEVSKFYSDFKGKTSIIGIYYSFKPGLIILDPKIARNIMISDFSHFTDTVGTHGVDKNIDPLLGLNPFFLKGDEWKEKRSEISPAFSTMRIKAIFPLIQHAAEQMIASIMTKTDKNHEMREISATFATKVIVSSVLGIDDIHFDSYNLRNLSRNVLKPSFRLIYVLYLAPLVPKITNLFKVKLCQQREETLLKEIFEEAVKLRKNSERQDFLDYLIQLKEKKSLRDVEISSHVLGFFLDGVETSSIALSNVFYELALNQNCQNRLRDELESLDYDSLSKNKYLENVILEALRLHPIMHMHFRECTKEKEIQLDDGTKVTIDKGTHIIFPVFDIQRDPEYFGPDAAVFNPDRFQSGLKQFSDNGVYFPFGDGPRMCLGQKLGMAQLKCCVAYFVSTFHVTISDAMPQQPKYDPFDFLLSYKSGVLLNLKPIK